MIDHSGLSVIHLNNVNLWAHVGVLKSERSMGQLFSLDFSLWLNIDIAAEKDDLTSTADYSIAIKKLQKLSLEIKCHTIEHFSEQILDAIENLYGSIPIHLLLRKCNPPIHGFTGSVSIERRRNFDSPEL